MEIGACVTLRNNRMYDFLEKMLQVSLPRVRDFRGLNNKAVDKTGNITVGFKEHLAFLEISDEDVENIFGLEICISTTAKNREHGLELFNLMKFPFKK